MFQKAILRGDGLAKRVVVKCMERLEGENEGKPGEKKVKHGSICFQLKNEEEQEHQYTVV
jgi:hypothetical protein